MGPLKGDATAEEISFALNVVPVVIGRLSQYIWVLHSSLCSNEHSCRFLKTSVMSAPCSVVLLSFLCFTSYFRVRNQHKNLNLNVKKYSGMKEIKFACFKAPLVCSMRGLDFNFAVDLTFKHAARLRLITLFGSVTPNWMEM